MRVIVCGGRDYTDGDKVREVLERLAARRYPRHRPLTIVHGAARGADQLAGEVARSLGLAVEEHPADWRGKGRGAGPARNIAMLAAGARLVVAFPGGNGTTHMVSIARKAGVPVLEVADA